MLGNKFVSLLCGVAKREMHLLRCYQVQRAFLPTLTSAAATIVCSANRLAAPFAPICANIQARNYAKGKDKKKEKGKKSPKVDINETLLRDFINLDGLNTQMQKAIKQMEDDFIKQLSLRSTTGAIDSLRVTIDGTDHELRELGQISRKNPKTIVINLIAFPQTIPDVIKALESSGMNLNPQQDGTTLFIPIPKVTKEHRESLSKNAKVLFIKYRDLIKDIQNNTIKKLKRQTEIGKDDAFAVQTQVTAIADKYVAEAEKLLATKQKELLGDA